MLRNAIAVLPLQLLILFLLVLPLTPLLMLQLLFVIVSSAAIVVEVAHDVVFG
jgi:hypothetical protein